MTLATHRSAIPRNNGPRADSALTGASQALQAITTYEGEGVLRATAPTIATAGYAAGCAHSTSPGNTVVRSAPFGRVCAEGAQTAAVAPRVLKILKTAIEPCLCSHPVCHLSQRYSGAEGRGGREAGAVMAWRLELGGRHMIATAWIRFRKTCCRVRPEISPRAEIDNVHVTK